VIVLDGSLRTIAPGPLEEARAHAREALQVWLDTDDVVVEEDVRPTTAAAG
jgi:hypothetical protein